MKTLYGRGLFVSVGKRLSYDNFVAFNSDISRGVDFRIFMSERADI